ncbi:MAG: hypothetical protein HFJ08_02675 [Lachnospiraceae bacterium]|nr:hypothetical protein [Lachnospiraceae bacterium]
MKKTVISTLSALMGAAIGAGIVGRAAGSKKNSIQAKSDKHFALFQMMDQWVRVKQQGKNLSEYFEEKGYKNIAIYGMNYAGQTLVEELKNTNTNVVYGIDRNADVIYADVDVLSVDDDFEPVDAIVVTAITFFDEIEKQLSKKIDCPIVSLEDVLYEV